MIRELRARGLTYAEISEITGLSAGCICRTAGTPRTHFVQRAPTRRQMQAELTPEAYAAWKERELELAIAVEDGWIEREAKRRRNADRLTGKSPVLFSHSETATRAAG
jgi:hypothetical protein